MSKPKYKKQNKKNKINNKTIVAVGAYLPKKKGELYNTYMNCYPRKG